ncbi:hypothetical protein [Staphylococcus saprophyticus]|uniref:hypothetical protein n=1 Tax=Staphylococcus saprophyticus TaxID=29385 RepID=UPI0034C5D8DE
MERDERQKMFTYLTKDNYKKYNEYLEGYYSAINLANDIGVQRTVFYQVAENIDPKVIEKRKEKRQARLSYIEQAIKNVVPYEYMEFDELGLFGFDRHSKNRPINKSKMDVAVMLKQNNNDLNGFKFISFKNMQPWYKKYLVSLEIQNNQSGKKGTEIAREYNMLPNKYYELKKYMDENEGRILSDVTLTQEEVFIKNAEMYRDYSDNNLSLQQLSEKYDRNEIYINPLLKAFSDAEKAIFS